MTLIKSTNPKDRIGVRKAPLYLLPVAALCHASLAMLNGMLKYGLANWRRESVAASVYVGAAQRHILKWFDCNEDYDAESGVHHLGHAIACLAIVIDAYENKNLIDDRPTSSKFDVDAFSERVVDLLKRLGQDVDTTPPLTESLDKVDQDLKETADMYDDYLRQKATR